MRNVLTIFRREINAYFNSAIAYIFIVVFVLISCGLFMTGFFLVGTADMRSFFGMLPLILCIFLPAVSMRLWAEDRKGNTLELLLTFPVKTGELTLGKFFASFVFYVAVLLCTLPIPIMISVLGDPDVGTIITGYSGALLMGAFFLAVGIFVSGLCRDQIVAFIISMMACFVFFLLGIEFTVSSIDGWLPGLGTFLRNALGMSQHFLSFEKGVIDNGDILYFLIGTGIFLTLNGFWLEGRMRPKSGMIFSAACVISLGIMTLVNLILVETPVGRFDLTEDRIHTISPAAGRLLRNLDAPVTAKLYISPPDKMPSGLKTLERDIRDQLEEFKLAARGNFNYKVLHMQATGVEEKKEEESLDEIVRGKGIRPFQVQSIETDEVGVKLIYSAMSVAYKERPEEIIPQIIPSNAGGLEYLIASKIHKMTLAKKPSVALVAPYEMKRVDPRFRDLMRQMGQDQGDSFMEDEYDLVSMVLAEYEGYDVSRIRLTGNEPIPDGINTLVVMEPKDLNERQLFEINRFLVNGGSVFLAVQQYDFEYMPYGPGGFRVRAMEKRPGINPLLKEWGLGVDKDFLMDRQLDVVSVSSGRLFGMIPASIPVKFPIQIKVISEQMNKEVSITSRLSAIMYLWGTAVSLDSEKLNESGLNARILFNSSRDSWTVPYHGGYLTKENLELPASEKRSGFPLAVLIEGQFPDAFNGKDVPAWPEEGEEAGEETGKEEITLTPAPGKLILLGCSAMFKRQLVQEGDHLDFFMNSADALTLGEELIEIRGKQPRDRTLKRLSSATRATWRVFTTFFVPVAVSVVGGARLMLRKRSKWVYRKMTAGVNN